MSSPNSHSAEYSRVSDKESDFESEEDFYDSEAPDARRRKRCNRILKCLKWSFWIVQILLLGANIFGFTILKKTIQGENAINPMRAPIRYKNVMMFDEKDTAPYQAVDGFTNAKVDAQWNKLLDIGAVKMDKAAKNRLLQDTSQAYGEDVYVGIMEFEHQLHCLNRIRKVFYGATLEDMGGTQANFTLHNDHCFQYLRQTLMCHADVAVMSTTAMPEIQAYIPNFQVVKQCRDFDLIHQWARELPEVEQDQIDGSRDPNANAHPPHHGGHGF